MAEIRAFIAVEVDQAIIDRLQALQDELREVGANVSWTRPEGMHLTLKFLGNITEDEVSSVINALEWIAAQFVPFTASVGGAGGFPNLYKARVLWAGVEKGQDELQALAHAIEEAMVERGFAAEERPYRAHLTLGRVKLPTKSKELAAQVAQHEAEQFGEMPVSEIRLMRSELRREGAHYTVMQRFPLSGSQ